MFHLPFVLLSDHGGDARLAFGVPRSFGFLPGRVTYVIDRDFHIAMIFNSQLRPDKHIKEALSVLAAADGRNVPRRSE
jgi:thioredoxin-dependent peroxiredoxin